MASTTFTSQTENSPLQIYVNYGDREQVEANLPVRWCVGPALLEAMHDAKVKNPHVLIVVSQNGQERSRYLADLAAEMAFVQFHHKGVHTITAAIVAPHGNDDVKFLRELLLGKPITHKDKAVLPSGWGTALGFFQKIERFGIAAELEVVVADDLFAKEPSKPVLWLVNLIFDTKGKDQCAMRKKIILMLCLSPFLAIAGFLTEVGIVVFAGICYVAGFYNLHFVSVVKHPWSEGFSELTWDARGSRWYTKPDGTTTHPLWWLINPLMFALVVGLGGGVLFLISRHVQIFLYLAIGLILAGLGFGFFSGQALSAYGWLDEKITAWNKKKADKELEEYYASLEELACNGVRSARFEDLPRSKRTIRLRAARAKNRVCKPYARQ